MKILQINAVYGVLSTGRTCRELTDKLVLEGHKSVTAYSEKTNTNENVYKIGNRFDHKLHAFLSRLSGLQGYYSINATRKLLKYIKKEQFDIVHLRNLHSNYINLPMLLKFLGKNDIPTVITLHDCWFLTGKCTHYIMTGCCKWQTGCNNCPRLRNDNPSWFFDRTKTMWKDKNRYLNKIPRLAVVGVSDWITDEARKSLLKDAKVIKRIYNWIDLEVFKPKSDNILKKYNIPNGKFNIIVAGAGWNKNSPKYKDVLKLSELIDETMQIILIGSCDDEVPANVIKTGYVKGTDDLASLYSAANVYVHVSREDTFGKVVAEALACGTPAVVYNSTALPELIGEGCGYVVDCEDVYGIYESIVKIKQKDKYYYEQKCRAFVEDNFEKNKNCNEYIELYNSILS